MNLYPSLLAAAALPSVHEMIMLMVWVAIAAIIIVAVVKLLKWAEIPIPQPVWIILAAFIGIALILLIARFFGLMA